MKTRAALACALFLAGCDAGVDFDADIVGKAFGRSGGALGSAFEVFVDFPSAEAVVIDASQTTNDVLVQAATASCTLGPAEQGLFETRVPGTDCTFESTAGDELPATPDAIVIGLKNFEDGSVELDPSLEEDLPSPFSFIDSYNRLDQVVVVE